MSGQGSACRGSTFSVALRAVATHLSSTCKTSEQFDISLVSHSFPGGGKDLDMGHFLLTDDMTDLSLGCCPRTVWLEKPKLCHRWAHTWAAEQLAALFRLILCLISVTQLSKPAQRNEGYPELQSEECSQSCLAFSMGHI